MGRDSLAAMAEQVRSRQLAQQVVTLTQRLAAQRCVATFLGSHEDALRAEVASLKRVGQLQGLCKSKAQSHLSGRLCYARHGGIEMLFANPGSSLVLHALARTLQCNATGECCLTGAQAADRGAGESACADRGDGCRPPGSHGVAHARNAHHGEHARPHVNRAARHVAVHSADATPAA